MQQAAAAQHGTEPAKRRVLRLADIQRDYIVIGEIECVLDVSNPTARSLAKILGRKVGREWRISKERFKRYMDGEEGGECHVSETRTGSIKTTAVTGGATSTLSPVDASSVLRAPKIARRRRSGAPRLRAIPGGRRGSAKRRR